MSGASPTAESGPPAAPDAASAAPRPPRVIALVGNPNTGKTTLFNALTGFRRHVANYPGVTVEMAAGPLLKSPEVQLLDLPGAYSLTPASPDEAVTRDVLTGRRSDAPAPDAILAILDAANPQRNFYLISQLIELGRPLVVALNMADIAERRGIVLDAALLARRVGAPVIPVTATQPETLEPLIAALTAPAAPRPGIALSLPARNGSDGADPAEVYARYAWVNQVLAGAVERRLPPGDTWSRRIDRVVTHRLWGALLLAAVLYGLFFTIYTAATPLMELVERGFGALGDAAGALLAPGATQSLLVDGVIGGVGGVVVFLPQIMILFLFIALLEDCGYLARAAFMVDRLMRPLGLSGRAFIPLLSSFACAVPAILGTRVIADRRERLITIMIAPFMSCSARLPVYVLLIGALIPSMTWADGWLRLDALVLLAMHLVGALVAIPVALLLRAATPASGGGGFLMELPGYKLPRPRAVAQRVLSAAREFLVRAGTIILLLNVCVWALGYFPRSDATRARTEAAARQGGWTDEHFDQELAGAYLRESYLGRAGRAIEPLIRPLGWDWRIGVGVIASFPAREVIVATLGTVFNLGAGEAEDSAPLRDAIQHATWDGGGRPLFTVAAGLSLMVFFALCAQCGSTLVVIGRETRSWLWPLASFVGMTTIAYFAAWGVYAAASAAGW